jgi:hypothetical protein
MSSYGQSPELTFFGTSGVGRKDVGSREFSSKDVGSIDVKVERIIIEGAGFC